MGSLVRMRDSKSVALPSSALVGRAATCWLRLEGRFASSEHAKLWFTGQTWTLRDLGSKNGTFVDGQRLEVGASVVLSPGSRIGFGEVEPGYEVRDVDPPRAMAQDVESGEVIEGERDLLALPGEDMPQLVLYPGASSWLSESDAGEVRQVEDLDVVRVDSRVFRLYLPGSIDATPMVDVAFSLQNASFRFSVSRDEERVAIDLMLRGREVARLESGEYGYLLLTLARARQEDGHRPPDERGWRSVDELCRMLRVDAAALNVAIHRARKRVAGTRLVGAPAVVEVKRGARRLGTERIEVRTLEESR
jgi:hypothetical protein